MILLYIALGDHRAGDRPARAARLGAGLCALCAAARCSSEFGAVELNVALTALVIGSALLLLSAFWHQARAAIVRPLPGSLRERLPLLDRTARRLPNQPHKPALERGQHAAQVRGPA